MIIDIKGLRQEGIDYCQPSKAMLKIEEFPGERGKGLKVGDKVILAPVYAYISNPIEFHYGKIFIMKNLDWLYGIVFVSPDFKVEIFQSEFRSPIIFLEEEGYFYCQDGGYFDYRGKSVIR